MSCCLLRIFHVVYFVELTRDTYA